MSRTKAFRRFKQFSKVKRRVEIYAQLNWLQTSTREEFRQKVKKGNCNWIRTTSVPCSCNMCSVKYKRDTKAKVDKIIHDYII